MQIYFTLTIQPLKIVSFLLRIIHYFAHDLLHTRTQPLPLRMVLLQPHNYLKYNYDSLFILPNGVQGDLTSVSHLILLRSNYVHTV